ncbi:MAG: AMP-binding protein [Gammaproteobacteria bacterium]
MNPSSDADPRGRPQAAQAAAALARRRPGLTTVRWPPLPDAAGAQLAALLFQLERTQWWSAAELEAAQLAQLERLLTHATGTVPWYRERLGRPLPAPGTLTAEGYRALPLLTRRDVQDAGHALDSRAVPAACGALGAAATSGSTGEPVRVRMSALDRRWWEALTLREHYWHAREFAGRLASIRVFDDVAAVGADGALRPSWGAPVARLHATGPMGLLPLAADVDRQAAWLTRFDPDYLLTYPTNLAALLEHAADHGWTLPRLREVRTVGETLPAGLRERCRERWGVALTDVYSSRELGYLAMQCPVSTHYHVMSETLYVEVLDERGVPVPPGGVGQLVVTPLTNFATPLLRYALNDWAELAPPCPCGRGLLTLARILGRTRHMVHLPDGSRHWPQVGFARFRDVAPVRQYQVIQHDLARLELRLVVDRALDAAEETRLADILTGALGHPFVVEFSYHERNIARGAGGKYEEFVCLVEQETRAGAA